MTIKLISENVTALPTALLTLAKQHCRIDHAHDDALLTSIIARAIARFQNVNEATLNQSVAVWKPVSGEFSNGAATLPARPASAIAVTAGDPPADVSADYALQLKWDSVHGIPIQALAGAFASGMTVTLTLGFSELPPAVLDVVLRHTAHLYEHREILIPGQTREYVAPDLAMDATWWMPRA